MLAAIIWLRKIIAEAKRLAKVAKEQAANPTCHIDARLVILAPQGTRLDLGQNVHLGANTVIALEDLSDGSRVIPAKLAIGNNTYIGELNNIRANATIQIGANCLISQGVAIIGSNHEMKAGRDIRAQGWRPDRLGVTIEDDVWIGANATVLPGVRIGRGAVIAAGSVVNRDVEAGWVVAGVPAICIKKRT
ncbi:MAG: acyltransferase [Rubrivivax sp.]